MVNFLLFIPATAIAALICIAVCRRSSQRNQEVAYL
jgi:hypothetical protein